MDITGEVPFTGFEIVMEFNSDEASNDDGFVVNLKQIVCENEFQLSASSQPDCDQTFDQTLFQIKSPDYPNLYPEGSSCTFKIYKANNNICQLVLEVETFDLALSKDCNNEYLMVDSGRLCGSLPRRTTST